MPEWLKGLIWVSLFLVCLGAFGKAFHSNMLLFFIFWLLLPLIVLGARSHNFLSLLTHKGIILFQGFSIGISVLIAVALFANYDELRDHYGKRHIEGYSVNYYEDSDDVGRPIQGSNIDTNHFSGRALIWLSEWVFMAFCFGIPALTWKATKLTVIAWEDINSMQNKESIGK